MHTQNETRIIILTWVKDSGSYQNGTTIISQVMQSGVHFVHNTSSSGSDKLGRWVGQHAHCLLGNVHFSHIKVHLFLRSSRPCRGSHFQYSATQGGGQGSVSGQFIWYLWWTKWHCDRFFLPVLRVFAPSIVPPVAHSYSFTHCQSVNTNNQHCQPVHASVAIGSTLP
jgi:hypothetical protein